MKEKHYAEVWTSLREEADAEKDKQRVCHRRHVHGLCKQDFDVRQYAELQVLYYMIRSLTLII